MEPPVQSRIYVSATRLRQLFNESQYPELILQNQLEIEVDNSYLLSELALQEKSLPPGTISEIIRYRDLARNLYVMVHRYVLPDGSLGASGKPDPKAILLDGTMFCWDGSQSQS